MKYFTLPTALLSILCFPARAAVEAHVFDAKSPGSEALYSYSLAKSREGGVELWTARITDSSKQEFADEKTWIQEGKLVRYSLRQPQLGEEAEVKKIPHGVVFRYFKEGKWKEDWEKTDETVITGPQIVDMVLGHWDHLLARKPLTVRFAVPDRLETFGFKFEVESTSAEKTIIRFVPSSFFIRQLVAPVRMSFDADKKLVSMTGPTFLKKKNGDRWEDLVAEVRFHY